MLLNYYSTGEGRKQTPIFVFLHVAYAFKSLTTLHLFPSDSGWRGEGFVTRWKET